MFRSSAYIPLFVSFSIYEYLTEYHVRVSNTEIDLAVNNKRMYRLLKHPCFDTISVRRSWFGTDRRSNSPDIIHEKKVVKLQNLVLSYTVKYNTETIKSSDQNDIIA